MKVKNLNNHIQHIVTGFKQQVQLYLRLLQMSQKLGKTLAEEADKAGDSDTADNSAKLSVHITEVMSERGLIIKDIAKLEEDIRPHKESVMNILHLKEFNLDKVQDLINADLRKDFFEQKRVLEKIIKEIIEIDHNNQMTMENIMQDVTAELKKIKQHHQIQQTYLDRPEKFPEPRFIDSKK